jgi:tetrahydromethanopterin S-methyltransferase subunit C
MKALLERKTWSGPAGVARIVAILSAIWVIVVSAASLIGVNGYTLGKVVLPMGLMLLSLGFLAGYQMGQSRR